MKTRAAVLWEVPGKWKVQEVELDEPGPTEVLVQLVSSGLCHSDDHYTQGDLRLGHMPFIGGHEGAGIVRKVGERVTDFEVGDHIITSFIPACGKCKWCVLGMSNLCNAGARILTGDQPSGGFRAHDGDTEIAKMAALGTFSEWQVFDQISIVKVDKAFDLHVISLVACGVQTGVGSATTAGNVRAGDVVLILGAGGIGMNAVQGARLSGAKNIVVVDPAPEKKDWAPKFGATEVFDNVADADAFVKSITDGQGADVSIVTIGVVRNEHIGQAFNATRKGGTIVVTGIGDDTDESSFGPGVNAFTIAMMQKKIQGAIFGMGSPRVVMPSLLEMYRDGKLMLDELVTKRYTLDQINEAYDDMRAGRNIRGVIDFVPVGEPIE